MLNKNISIWIHTYKIPSSEKSFGLKNHIESKIAEIETPEIFMYCFFSDTPRFSDSILTNKCVTKSRVHCIFKFEFQTILVS